MSFGVYVHVPFCKSKCPYCDFYSVLLRDPEIKEKYTDALVSEIRAFAKYLTPGNDTGHSFIKEEPDSIYFGGGTPSLLEPIRVREIIKACDDTFGRALDREITLEANPGTVDRDTLKGYRAMGVNRLSLGVQSFDDEILKKLGRTHRAADSEAALKDARDAGFSNISIDLIFGIEGQTMEAWEMSLKKALKLKPEHISLYSLEFMEGTVFTRRLQEGKMKETDPEEDRAMYERAVELLKEAGYEHYEISNFALPGFESRHNLKYWNLDDYAGFGPGAHSYMTDLKTGQGQRYYHLPYLKAYIEDPLKVEMMEPNGYADDMTEFTITALRLSRGIDKIEFSERFGQDFWEFYGDLTKLQFKSFIDTGHAWEDEEHVGLTLKGFNVSNQILSLFV
ncbi:MAG: radical SAM family heme chaperone HemW [Firmicutes bacterium]|nr:radical SAM family heme chaperone HemW [Bacillota bacterium]